MEDNFSYIIFSCENNCWPTVGRLLADCWPSCYRQIANAGVIVKACPVALAVFSAGPNIETRNYRQKVMMICFKKPGALIKLRTNEGDKSETSKWVIP